MVAELVLIAFFLAIVLAIVVTLVVVVARAFRAGRECGEPVTESGVGVAKSLPHPALAQCDCDRPIDSGTRRQAQEGQAAPSCIRLG